MHQQLLADEIVVKAAVVYVEQPICTEPLPSEIKVQISPLVMADLWQIFAGLASTRLLATHCLSAWREFAARAIYRRRSQTKKINRLPSPAERSALDVERLPCANGCSEAAKLNLAVGNLSQ